MSDSPRQRVWQFLSRAFSQSLFLRSLASDVTMNDPVVAGKIYPYGDEASWWLENAPATSPELDPAKLPIPPRELWEGYGKTAEQYLGSGSGHVAGMLKILARDGLPIERTKRVLDFGSSSGRMLRWLTPYAEGRELWGVDIGSKAIHWATLHLSPPLRFATTTTAPHLPFEDSSFDLIYCGSVFSHITDLADAWLLELRRILRPGGALYVTIHDKNSLRLLLEVHETKLARWLRAQDAKEHFSTRDFSKLVLARTPKNAQTFYDVEYLRRVWGQHFEFVSVNPEAYGYQTALVLRKP